MDPVKACIRGVKISASNPELAVLSWAVNLATGLLLAVPLALWVVGMAVWLAGSEVADASGADAFLKSSELLLDHWPAVLAALLAGVVWAGAVISAYLYAQAGFVGCAVRAHRRGPSGDWSLKPKLGANPAFAVFSLGAFWEEVRAHGWRVTVVATAYSGAGTIPLLLAVPWEWWCIWQAFEGGAALAMGVAGALFGLAVLLLLFLALAIHYRFAIVIALQRSCGWREAVGAANALFRSRPLEALAVVGFTIAARYALGIAFIVLSLPLIVLSAIPGVGPIFIPFRILLSVLQGLLSSAITVAATGATAALCEPMERGDGGGVMGRWGVGSRGD